MEIFHFCPVCGKSGVSYEGRKWFCEKCGFTLYNSVAAAAVLILYDEENYVLFEKRAKDPQKGRLALPGGFVGSGEEAEAALKRECMEELNYESDNFEYLCSLPNFYPYKKIDYSTCDIVFTHFSKIKLSKLIKSLKMQQEEVAALETRRILCQKDIKEDALAFHSNAKALSIFLKKKLKEGKCADN